MGAFFIVRHESVAIRAKLVTRVGYAMEQQGFARPKRIQSKTCDIYLYAKLRIPGKQLHYRDRNNFACFVGTPLFKGATGQEAAKLLFEDFVVDTPDWSDFSGQFCGILCRGGEINIFTDRLGIYKVFIDKSENVISSSFLTVVDSLDSRTIDSQSVYEYVFQGATYGGTTVIQEVIGIDCAGRYRLDRKSTIEFIPWRDRVPLVFNNAPSREHIEKNLGNLRHVYDNIKACFGDHIDSALSGGYDSRLTLALIREQGIQANIHVYGKKTDDDVKVACAIASQEGLSLAHIDKSEFPDAKVDEFQDIVERNFQIFDGFPSDGIFDSGADISTRLQRCAGGELMLNGGGGEIFRNFFYLLDFRFSILQFLWSFYNRYDPRACSRLFSENAYLEQLKGKITATLGLDDEALSRPAIEYLYPAFRCRFWMGKNNSINNRLGWSLTPFIDYTVVRDAVTVPLNYKNYGRFEAALIKAVDPKLAEYDSVYGHNFSDKVPTSRILADWSTYLRPTFLRRYTYRLKFRKQRPRTKYLNDPYIGSVLDTKFPYLSAYFHVELVNDPEAFARICTLEYLFKRFTPAMDETIPD